MSLLRDFAWDDEDILPDDAGQGAFRQMPGSRPGVYVYRYFRNAEIAAQREGARQLWDRLMRGRGARP